jgi:hypothetical protein
MKTIIFKRGLTYAGKSTKFNFLYKEVRGYTETQLHLSIKDLLKSKVSLGL